MWIGGARPTGCRIWLRMPETRDQYDEWLEYHGRPKLTDDQWTEILKSKNDRLGPDGKK